MEHGQGVLDVYRTMTAILLIIGMVLSIRNRVKYKTFWNRQEELFIRGAMFLAFASVVGLSWNIAHHATLNIGLPFTTIGAVFIIASSLAKPERLENAEQYLQMKEKRESDADTD